MLLPQLLRCRRQCLHLFLHNLAHSEVDTAPVKVLVAAAALVDADADGQALISAALRRAASVHLAVAPLPPAPESSNLRAVLQRSLEGLDDPVAARWRLALQR